MGVKITWTVIVREDASFERVVKNAKLENPNSNVEIRVNPEYLPGNNSSRPYAFSASYRIGDGRWEDYFYENKQGG